MPPSDREVALPISLPEAGSYHGYCVRQRRHTSALTLESAEVREWIEFFENNDGTLPDWPLPLGDPFVPCDVIGAQLLDKRQTLEFEIRLPIRRGPVLRRRVRVRGACRIRIDGR